METTKFSADCSRYGARGTFRAGRAFHVSTRRIHLNEGWLWLVSDSDGNEVGRFESRQSAESRCDALNGAGR